MNKYLVLSRVHHWVKNGIIFGPLLFSHHFFHKPYFLKTTLSFLAFSLVASGVYVLNDIVDSGNDRCHPEKMRRPLASGVISTRRAGYYAAGLFLAGGAASSAIGTTVSLLIATYVLLNLMYTFYLKDIVIIDVLCISAGFVIRVFVGAHAIDVKVSPWIILCTMLLSLFLAFSKRREEIVLYENTPPDSRPVLMHYNASFLDQMIAVVTSATVISYAIYTVSPETIRRVGTENLIYTVPFVMYGIFRYLYLVYKKDSGENPTRILFTDIPLILTIVLWVLACFVIIY